MTKSYSSWITALSIPLIGRARMPWGLKRPTAIASVDPSIVVAELASATRERDHKKLRRRLNGIYDLNFDLDLVSIFCTYAQTDINEPQNQNHAKKGKAQEEFYRQELNQDTQCQRDRAWSSNSGLLTDTGKVYETPWTLLHSVFNKDTCPKECHCIEKGNDVEHPAPQLIAQDGQVEDGQREKSESDKG
ncbi:hypothetical protein HG530_011531 [Fusarium avenaceum]|nr:hypothetical protein HG530_011531 [Fusarium avenaceum]